MSFSMPILCYHSHADLIWPDGTFNGVQDGGPGGVSDGGSHHAHLGHHRTSPKHHQHLLLRQIPPPEDIPQVGGGRIRYRHQRTFYRWEEGGSDTTTWGHSTGGKREDQIPPTEDIPQVRGGRIRYHQQRTFHRWDEGGSDTTPEDIPQVRGGRIRYHHQRIFHRWEEGESDTTTRGHSTGGRREDKISSQEDIPKVGGGRTVRRTDTDCPGLDPSILWHSGIWGAAIEAVLNKVRKKIQTNPPFKKVLYQWELLTLTLEINKTCSYCWELHGESTERKISEKTSDWGSIDSNLGVCHVFRKKKKGGNDNN